MVTGVRRRTPGRPSASRGAARSGGSAQRSQSPAGRRPHAASQTHRAGARNSTAAPGTLGHTVRVSAHRVDDVAALLGGGVHSECHTTHAQRALLPFFLESRPSAALPGSALRPAESVHSSGRGWISTVGDHRALAARGVLVVDPKAHHLLISLHACGNSGERSTRAVAVPQRRTVPGRHRIWQRPPAPVRPWEPTPGYGRDTAAGPASPLGQHSPSGTNVESARPVAPPHELTAHGPTAHKTEATRADRRRGRTHRPSIPQAPRTGRGSHRSTGTGRTGVAPGERPGRDAGGFAAPGRRRPGRPTAGAAPWEGRCAFAAVGPVDAGVGSRSLVEVP